MEAERYPFEYLDLVIQAFVEPVGFFILPTVLDVIHPVSDGAGGGVDSFHFGNRVFPDPFCQVFILDRVRKEQQGITSFRQIWCEGKGIAEPVEIFMVTRSPVILLVNLLSLQEAGNALDFPVVFHVVDILERILIAEANWLYYVIEPFNGVES